MRSAAGRATLAWGVAAVWLLAGCSGGGAGGEPSPPGAGAPAGERRASDGGSCEDATLRPARDNLERVQAATLCLVNARRAERGREPLARDPDLERAARDKARDMVEGTYFAHVGPDDRDVRDWVRGTGYLDGLAGIGGYRLGENLGWASEGGATPAQLVEGWMNSDSHRRNLLHPQYADSGIGIALGAPRPDGGGGATYVHVLGAR